MYFCFRAIEEACNFGLAIVYVRVDGLADPAQCVEHDRMATR